MALLYKRIEGAMKEAIGLIQSAPPEVAPFACLILDRDGNTLARTTGTGTDRTPTRHCEVTAIEEVAKQYGKLEGMTLVSSFEPCLMCSGAVLHAHLSAVAWGATRSQMPDLFRPYAYSGRRLLDSSHPPRLWPCVLQQQVEEAMRASEWARERLVAR